MWKLHEVSFFVVEFPTSCNVFVNPGGLRERDGVVTAATGVYNSNRIPLISIRVDKPSLIITLNGVTHLRI